MNTEETKTSVADGQSELTAVVMRIGPTANQFVEANRRLVKAANSAADAMRAFVEMAEKMKIEDEAVHKWK